MGTPLLRASQAEARPLHRREAHPVRSMLSGHCHSEAHAATPETAPEYHRRCTGAWPRPDGALVTCPCPRHAGEYRCRICRHDHTNPDEYDPWGRQCVDHDACATRISRAQASNPVAKELREATAAPRRPGRDCECACGGTTRGGRFLPGHDAKLKGRLLRQAADGDQGARDELRRRGWEKR
jgi:hypothetical protein